MDSEGHLYLAGDGGAKKSKDGKYEAELGGEHATGIAVDASSNEVYVGVAEQVKAYNAHGVSTEQFGSGHLPPAAVSRSTPSQTVYVADAAVSEVAVFGSVVLPDVSTGAEPTNLEHEGSVTLNGTVDPDGEPVTSCQFEYGTETSYGSVVPCDRFPGRGRARSRFTPT